jgi:CRISPR/Cas system-associated endonuclease Cas1
MKTKTVKIALDSFGSFLGREKGCLTVRNKEGKVKRYPLFENEISEIRIKSGNIISAGALATCGFWNIDCLILTRHGNPIATVRSLTDDSHVETRICQYEALKNDKCLEIAKQIVLAKIRGQNELLRKYGLRSLDVCYYSRAINELTASSIGDSSSSLLRRERRLARNRLMSYEGKCSD